MEGGRGPCQQTDGGGWVEVQQGTKVADTRRTMLILLPWLDKTWKPLMQGIFFKMWLFFCCKKAVKDLVVDGQNTHVSLLPPWFLLFKGELGLVIGKLLLYPVGSLCWLAWFTSLTLTFDQRASTFRCYCQKKNAQQVKPNRWTWSSGSITKMK